jgi:hypothetical protein
VNFAIKHAVCTPLVVSVSVPIIHPRDKNNLFTQAVGFCRRVGGSLAAYRKDE